MRIVTKRNRTYFLHSIINFPDKQDSLLFISEEVKPYYYCLKGRTADKD